MESKLTLAHKAVGDIVSTNYRLASVFKRFGIDFCCDGGKTLEQAARAAGIDPAELERALREARTDRTAPSDVNPAEWDLDVLATYIVETHHDYVSQALPILQAFSQKVSRVHGARYPQLIEIARLVEELAVEMRAHMLKEERILFPYVRELVAASQNGGSLSPAPFGTVGAPIKVMEREHDRAAGLMRSIRALANDFSPPDDACKGHRATYAKLEEFEEDLHYHVHLENNILFPKAEVLEAALAVG
jgi:regulator of cell morphogenesis and NO signaling